MFIHFFTEGTVTYPCGKATREWLEEIAQKSAPAWEGINYIFCNNNYLLDINQRYLGHHTYTDVITFPFHDAGAPLCGDIYISMERVGEQAQEWGTSLEEELHRVMVHGLFHLCGYDDQTPEEKQAMTRREDEALASLFFHLQDASHTKG